MYMRSGFKSLNDVFRKEKSLEKIRELVDSSDVVYKFFDIFPNLKEVTEPISCEKNTLIIKVENPAWRNELKFMEAEMVEKINVFFKEKRIKQIRFVG